MFGLGTTEILIIVVVLGIIFFGGNKVKDFAHSAGRFSGEFKKGKSEISQELKKVKDEFENGKSEIEKM